MRVRVECGLRRRPRSAGRGPAAAAAAGRGGRCGRDAEGERISYVCVYVCMYIYIYISIHIYIYIYNVYDHQYELILHV